MDMARGIAPCAVAGKVREALPIQNCFRHYGARRIAGAQEQNVEMPWCWCHIALQRRSGLRASPHFSHPERGVRLRPVPRAVLEAPQSGMCTPRTGVQEPEADSGYGNAQRGVLVKIDAAQGTAPQGLSRGKAFQALLEIGAAEGRSIRSEEHRVG